jgi:glycoprotein 2-beta-D-xylosyltransferase
MTDWYNAFLVMAFSNQTSTSTNIILLDAHPRGVLDPVWPVLFNSSRRLSRLPLMSSHTRMVWSIQGYNSPLLNHAAPSLPLCEEFRAFFLSSHGVSPDPPALDCSSVRVLFIWRRDYVAHPRRPDGHVVRKIHNEGELLDHLQRKYQSLRVAGAQIDQFEMVDQLRQAASTDILVGMHGAGLTHALFLPRHASLIELFPVYWSSANRHFKAIAKWRSLSYLSWENTDHSLEKPNHFTRVPIGIIDSLVKRAYSNICKQPLNK